MTAHRLPVLITLLLFPFAASAQTIPATGRYVEVVKHNILETRLHISEIEVFAFGTTPDGADADGTSQNDLVQAGSPAAETPPTTTALEHGNPAAVFDGDLESGAAVWTTADELGVEPRYMLDLGATLPIGEVRIWGRADDCCAYRLQNFSVKVYADNGAGQPGELVNSVLFPDEAPDATVGPAELTLALPDPGVRSFAVDKPFIPAGEPIVLSWEVIETATAISIDNGVGNVTNLTDAAGVGSVTVTPGPSVDTTYMLDVTYPGGNTVASLTVRVTEAPVIFSFAADAVNVAPGTTVELTWSVASVTALELNGVDMFGMAGTTVVPSETTDYVLTGSNQIGETSRTVRVRVIVPGEPIISEFMADNSGDATVDEDGDGSDWIELCNPSAVEAPLHGYYLTDNPANLTKWRIPDVSLPAGGYLVIFASGKDRADPAAPLHTNFSLAAGGEYLALVKPDGVSVVVDFFPAFPAQRPEVSYGFDEDNAQEGYFIDPTPGAQNAASFTGFVGDTMFSVDRGFYTSSIDVEITTSEPGSEIRYTLNGAKPTATSGLIYSGPIRITRPTILRAAGFKPGFVPTNVDTQTYLFTRHIIAHPNMLTSITRNPAYAPLMDASLQAVPTLSLVFPRAIDRTEQECSVEFINFEAGNAQYDVGMARYGNYVTNFPKQSLRLTFKSEYGPGKLRFPIFAGHEYKTEPAAEVNALDLRSGNHDMAARGAYMSNRFTDDTMDAMGNIAPHGRFVHIYVNGVYNGQYHMRERWQAAMLAQYFPGAEEVYESVNANNTGGDFLDGIVTEGSGLYWNRTKLLVRGSNPFTRAGTFIDYPNVIDFMLLWVSGNSESEFRSCGGVPAEVPFKFFMKDADGFLRSPGHPVNHKGPIDVMERLRIEGDPDYKILLADRIHKHFFNDGAFTPAKNIARLQKRVDEISLSFLAEAARWNYRTPSSWEAFQNNLINSHFPSLTQNMINSFRTAGMYPFVVAPVYNQHGGSISSGFNLVMSAPSGTIYYTTDGSDPRVARTSAVSPLAMTYNGPLTLTETQVVRSRVRNGATWSALNEATFAIDSSGLVVSEFMYDPLSPTEAEIAAGFTNGEDFEFFELFNVGATTIDLAGIVIDSGINFDFATGAITSLAPGERLLVVENADAFAFRYGPGHPIAGQYSGKLEDAGEYVRIKDALDAALIEFTYDNKAPWPTEAAGNGSSLVLKDPVSGPDHNNPANWMASGVAGGTPGGEDVMSFVFGDWAAANGVTNPGDDDDGDSSTNFEEFVRGTPPLVFSPGELGATQVEFLEVGGVIDAYLTIRFTYSLAAQEVRREVEVSRGLSAWDAGAAFTKHVGTLYHTDGTATATWRIATPVGAGPEEFIRVVFESP